MNEPRIVTPQEAQRIHRWIRTPVRPVQDSDEQPGITLFVENALRLLMEQHRAALADQPEQETDHA